MAARWVGDPFVPEQYCGLGTLRLSTRDLDVGPGEDLNALTYTTPVKKHKLVEGTHDP